MERAARALATDPPDLEDTTLSKTERRRPHVDLGALDTLGPINKKRE